MIYHTELSLSLTETSNPNNWLLEQLQQQLQEDEQILNFRIDYVQHVFKFDGSQTSIIYKVEFDLSCEYYPKWIQSAIEDQLLESEKIINISIKE